MVATKAAEHDEVGRLLNAILYVRVEVSQRETARRTEEHLLHALLFVVLDRASEEGKRGFGTIVCIWVLRVTATCGGSG